MGALAPPPHGDKAPHPMGGAGRKGHAPGPPAPWPMAHGPMVRKAPSPPRARAMSAEEGLPEIFPRFSNLVSLCSL